MSARTTSPYTENSREAHVLLCRPLRSPLRLPSLVMASERHVTPLDVSYGNVRAEAKLLLKRRYAVLDVPHCNDCAEAGLLPKRRYAILDVPHCNDCAEAKLLPKRCYAVLDVPHCNDCAEAKLLLKRRYAALRLRPALSQCYDPQVVILPASRYP